MKRENKLRVLIFGNIMVEGDNFAFKLIPELERRFSGVEFRDFDPTEDLQEEGRNLFIIDAVVGLEKVKELVLENEKDFLRVELNSGVGMHDFDLGYNLRLLKNLDLIDSVKIICVPMVVGEGGCREGVGGCGVGEKKVLEDICEVLEMWGSEARGL